MASVQSRPLADGTPRWRVLWREDGKQRNLTFWDEDSAGDFARDIDLHGAEEALRIRGVIDAGGRGWPAGCRSGSRHERAAIGRA